MGLNHGCAMIGSLSTEGCVGGIASFWSAFRIDLLDPLGNLLAVFDVKAEVLKLS